MTQPNTPPEERAPERVLSASHIQDVLVDVAQLLDGWHQDGTAWSEWDESVRCRVSEILLANDRRLHPPSADGPFTNEKLHAIGQATQDAIRHITQSPASADADDAIASVIREFGVFVPRHGWTILERKMAQAIVDLREAMATQSAAATARVREVEERASAPEQGRPIRYVAQEESNGCGVACLAMLTNDSYWNVRARFREANDMPSQGLSEVQMLHYLNERGFWYRRYWVDLPVLPMDPLVLALVDNGHWILVQNGDVIDPARLNSLPLFNYGVKKWIPLRAALRQEEPRE